MKLKQSIILIILKDIASKLLVEQKHCKDTPPNNMSCVVAMHGEGCYKFKLIVLLFSFKIVLF